MSKTLSILRDFQRVQISVRTEMPRHFFRCSQKARHHRRATQPIKTTNDNSISHHVWNYSKAWRICHKGRRYTGAIFERDAIRWVSFESLKDIHRARDAARKRENSFSCERIQALDHAILLSFLLLKSWRKSGVARVTWRALFFHHYGSDPHFRNGIHSHDSPAKCTRMPLLTLWIPLSHLYR